MKKLEVALLVKTNSEWHRNVLMGVAQFSEDAGGWNFTIPNGNADGELRLPLSWQGDGVICRASSSEIVENIHNRGLPCVNVSWLRNAPEMPAVVSDEVACAQMAAEFLIEKQYDHFGYVGFYRGMNYSSSIEDTLRASYADSRRELHVFQPIAGADESNVQRKKMTQWLRDLPKPVAIVAWSSDIGNEVTKACWECGFDVPQTVAILCIEHDHLWSSLAPVPLSNIDQDPWLVGYTAGKLLNALIKGDDPPPEAVRVSPISVVQRLSTEASAVKDPILGQAINLIFERAKTGITVKELVSELDISRRALESRFRKDLNCSPAAYIRRIQLRAVARLLRTSKLNIASIAHRTGFVYPEVLMRSFKREFGMTPMQFRGAGPVRVVESKKKSAS